MKKLQNYFWILKALKKLQIFFKSWKALEKIPKLVGPLMESSWMNLKAFSLEKLQAEASMLLKRLFHIKVTLNFKLSHTFTISCLLTHLSRVNQIQYGIFEICWINRVMLQYKVWELLEKVHFFCFLQTEWNYRQI